MKRKLLVFALAICAFSVSQAQTDTAKKAPVTGRTPGTALGSGTKAEPKPYATVITNKALTRQGMITTHKLDDKYFFEIADTTLGRDILVVARISKSGSEVRAAQGYAGDPIGGGVIRFEKGPNNRIFMRKVSFQTYSPDSTTAMYQNLMRSSIMPIAASFNIAAYTPSKNGSVIDVTEYLNSDNNIFYFSSPASKTRFKLGAQLADRSYISNVRSFPTNVEITVVKTYAESAAPGAPAGGGTATIELNTSLVILPKVPMKVRHSDPRVGYFTVGYTDFDLNPQGVKNIELIKRWRLEPKPGDMAKYRRGELVEPQKQIVYYIDPATPAKWVPYLIAGVNDWQKAFEKAGFKNAVVAKMAPTYAQDSTWSLDDARHSAIVYKPSEIANASGPSISDPRSGEIMETHINWYHNVMSLVHDWYMVQTAAVDPRARSMEFSDELMGDLIRFVSSHEVGHTLGLLHNFGSSSTVPTENLRNKAWVEANGHTPSIMDYARFNYVAQPEDNISSKGLYPRIGDYDNWAINWGYRIYDTKTTTEEATLINKLTMEAAKNPRLWFGTESNPNDPRSQSEDLSNNAMVASTYGIKNLKVILAKLPEWTKGKNEGYDDLQNMYNQLTGQFGRYMGHVAKNVGGILETPKMVEQGGVIYERNPAAKQREAMTFLNTQLFTTPTWLLNQQILDVTGTNGIDIISKLQEPTLNRLVGKSNLTKLINAEAADGASAYKVTDLFSDLDASIFTELKSNAATDVYRRNLQKSYVDKLIAVITPVPAAAPSPLAQFGRGAASAPSAALGEAMSMVKGELTKLGVDISMAALSQSDRATKYHLMDLAGRIKEAMDTNKK